MGMLLVLVGDQETVTLGADWARRLASLGVTRLAVLQDREGLAVALEGWAFDPIRLATAAFDIVAPGAADTRTLHQVAEIAVAEGATDR